MSTSCLKKPSRPPPPPPPPIEYPSSHRHAATFNFHRPSNSASQQFGFGFRDHSSQKKLTSKSDYIKISECHTGIPDRHSKTMFHKPRASTSFSSTLKPSSASFTHSSHQKSRSLTDNHSSYLYLDFPSNFNHNNNNKNETPASSATEYRSVDFAKTDALNKCKVERNSGRASLK